MHYHQGEVPPRQIDQRAARDLLELGGAARWHNRSRRARMISVLALTWESSPRPSKDFDACRCASKA